MRGLISAAHQMVQMLCRMHEFQADYLGTSKLTH